MKGRNTFSRIISPILGGGAIGVCPLCWAGSAAFLSYVGLGALIPIWQWLAAILILIGLIGLIFDYKVHKNIFPILYLIIGGILLYTGRYIWGGPGFTGWPIWGAGAILIIIAVWQNKKQF